MAAITPNAGEIRKHVPETCRRRSYAWGVGLFLLAFSAVTGSFLAAVLLENIGLKFLAATACGVFISVLFILGHDACHSILTPSARLNAVLSRLCFLPTLNPTTAWELGHNQLHHGWTNLKGMDYAYRPYSPEEFRALPAWRRGLERIYRTVPGITLFYIIDLWAKHLIFPRPHEWRRLHKGWFAFDMLLVMLFAAAVISFSGWIGWRQGGGGGVAANFLIAVLWAHLVWSWFMGFATIQQHTHPRVPWFESRDEWNFFFGQIEGTVYVRMPRLLELFFHDVFDHNAHHVDPKIPVYNLHRAQQELALAYPRSITIIHTSPWALGRTLRVCKLYDYRRHCWTDFEGRPTGDRILVPKTEFTRNAADGCIAAAG
jgi:omega-6 fatty acid desaturase (delta-12 desaturase)